MAKKNWKAHVRRWMQINMTEEICTDDHLEEWRRVWKSAPYEGVILNCIGAVRYTPCGEGFVSPAKGLKDQDIFGRFADAARADGLVIAARFDLQDIMATHLDTHPEWFRRNKNGEVRIAPDTQTAATCVNSSYYTDVIPKLLTEITETYGPEIITDNSWRGGRKSDICYCENCRKKFKEDTGLDLPGAPDYKDPDYREWIRWSYGCRNEIWKRFSEVVAKAGDGNTVWSGMLHADPMDRISELTDFSALCKDADVLVIDHQSRDMVNGMDMEQNAMNGSMFRLMAKEDAVIVEIAAHYPRLSFPHWYRLSSSVPAETLMWEMEAIAGGMMPAPHYMGTSTWDARRYEISKELLYWHEKNQDLLENRREIADAAVVWSQENGDFYGRGDYHTLRGATAIAPWEGYRHAMTRGRVPFLPLNAHDIDRHGSRVKTLVLPELACISEEDAKAIGRFLDRGGNLVLTGKSLQLDEYGEPWAEHTGGKALLDRLGLTFTGTQLGAPFDNPRYFGKEGHSYLMRQSDDEVLFDGLTESRVIAFGGALQEVFSTGPLACAASMIPGIPLSPCEFSYPDPAQITSKDNPPAILYGTLPEGGRVVYFAADLDRCYGRDEFPDHAKMLQNAVRWTLSDQLQIQVFGPGYVDVKTYEQETASGGRRLLVHLVNLTGSNTKAGLSEEFLPVGPLQLQLPQVSVDAVQSVRGTVRPDMVTVSSEGEALSIGISVLTDHELLVIDL